MNTRPLSQTPRALKIATWIAQVVAAAILLQTLAFKFTGAAEAKATFEALGAEPFGRYAVGVAELIVGLLLLIPATAALGGLGAIALMVGAIGSHLFTPLGIAPGGDPSLFILAWVVLFAGITVAAIRRAQLKQWAVRLLPGGQHTAVNTAHGTR
ncbi:MAG: DoxX family protein [Opitutales bacterium]